MTTNDAEIQRLRELSELVYNRTGNTSEILDEYFALLKKVKQALIIRDNADVFTECYDMSVDLGWMKLIGDAIDEAVKICKANDLTLRIYQIKEKFGGLRVYTSVEPYGDDDNPEQLAAHDKIDAIFSALEKTAGETCERCGEHGTLVADGWMKTLCETHAKAKIARDAARAAELDRRAAANAARRAAE